MKCEAVFFCNVVGDAVDAFDSDEIQDVSDTLGMLPRCTVSFDILNQGAGYCTSVAAELEGTPRLVDVGKDGCIYE